MVIRPCSVHTQRPSLEAGHLRNRAIADQLRRSQRIG
jgi:hypothetical protein